MASRNVVQHQNRGGEAVPKGLKQKNMGAAEGGRNRRALGDIGNLVTKIHVVDGKPIPQASRPVTRSFCAQIMAKAQAAAAAENKLKCNAVELNAPDVKAVGVRKPTQKKATPKQQKPEELIDISLDTEENDIEKKRANKKRATLTATLTARSKAACGLSNKPEDQIADIDAADVNNELAVVEYIDDMHKFYKLAETETRVHDYIDSQHELNAKMRAILIDWLVEVHTKFELNPETLYLTVNIVDRYLAKKQTSRRELQLVGLGSMLIASKYEEIWAPEVLLASDMSH
ncbi:hypothetical protein Leryth_019066 [Lithospermum erythrorhizon]|nr:hypothetical protein Leryth_019066 [Lithospermum erythrorhizon]